LTSVNRLGAGWAKLWSKENAMPLTPEQLKTLKSVLEKRRVALIAELEDDAARVRAEPFAALAGESPDSGDESVADAIADTDQADLTRDLGELRAVEAALDRFEVSRYGFCKECGVEIPLARLQANPAASRCAACQGRHEKTYRGARPATL
jgi:RNA polymerase-binding transcription factor DksA